MSISTERDRQVRGRAASLALGVTIGLTVFKLGVGWVTGSAGVMAEGVHSFLDLISAAIAFFTVREAAKEADLEHPFGHGKFETLSSLVESLLLIGAGALIIWDSVEKFGDPQPIAHEGLAIGTIALSMVISYWVYRQNKRAAAETDSAAIEVNALHFLSDVVASGGVLAGLLLMKATGWLWIDPLMAFAVGAYILGISHRQVRSALRELLDTRLPEDEVKRLRGILKSFQGRVVEAHDLRTRKSGAVRHVDFHLLVCGYLTVNHSHKICDEMEDAIEKEFPRSSVSIHVEPCGHDGVAKCTRPCENRPRD